MGYKLAGCEVLGGVEIDKGMMALYRANNNPRYSYLMGVQDFNKIPLEKIPEDLKNLDILDGSPPCSVFSTAGKRHKKWGEENYFREGQAKQKLDDLFFHFIETADRLRPKVVIAENVKGLILGKARGYVKEIISRFGEAGYSTQIFLLNSARMGVPQVRERVFFIARRNDIEVPKIHLSFDEGVITLKEAFKGSAPQGAKLLSKKAKQLWANTKRGDTFSKAAGGNHLWFSSNRLAWERPARTVQAGSALGHPDEPRYLSPNETIRCQSFPEDYSFLDQDAIYVMGMSVPPFMIQRLAKQVAKQWLLPTEEKREAV